jgi:hypothetical protein
VNALAFDMALADPPASQDMTNPTRLGTHKEKACPPLLFSLRSPSLMACRCLVAFTHRERGDERGRCQLALR